MKGLSLTHIRSGRLACSFILITSLLVILFYYCYIRSYAMTVDVEKGQDIEESVVTKSIEEKEEVTIEKDSTALAGAKAVEEVEEVEKTVYEIPKNFVNPVSQRTVSYRGGKTIERSSKITFGESGLINQKASPDQDGFMKLDGRYLIAVGSRFSTHPGQYIDLILQNGVVIQCIMGDAKADIDTDSTNTFTYRSSCCSEFIIDEKTIRKDIYERGNASLKHYSWDSPVVRVVVYDDYHEL